MAHRGRGIRAPTPRFVDGDRQATPRWRVWPCAAEWHPAFRHAPAAGPGACSCSATLARPGAACATIAGRFVPVARAWYRQDEKGPRGKVKRDP